MGKIVNMDKQTEIELIKLEVLGCIDNTESKNLCLMKETNEDFPWKELAEYQNLASLLPSTLVAEIPSPSAKDNMVRKLNHSIFGAEANNELEIIEIKEEKTVDVFSEKLTTKDNIDWDSLAISDTLPIDLSSFQEVKTKKSIDRNEFIKSTQITKDLEKENLLDTSFYKPKIKPEKNPSTSKNLKRYVLISAALIVALVSVTAYFLIPKTDEVTEAKNEIFTPVDKTPALLKVVSEDSFIPFVIPENVTSFKNEEIKTEEKKDVSRNKQNILPTAPPALPEPIDAPLVELTKDSPVEDSKVKEEISLPPPKENLEINEEPTYFVAVEEMPEPVGGLQEIQSRIEYPVIAKRVGIEGKVFVRAFVDEKGTVTSAEVVKGIGGGCDEAALDAILKTTFTPGKQRGKPIKVQVTIPILFKL
jgi:protein TonB